MKRRALVAVLTAAAAATVIACAPAGSDGADGPPAEIEPQAVRYVSRPPNTLSFNRDIAPLVLRHCSPCHRPGESAPFPLLTYEQVRKRADQIVTVTESRFMPPWLPEPGYAEYAAQRGLSVDEIGVIRQWVAEGTAEGDPADRPPAREWTAGWQLGQPDLVVETPEAFRLRADGPDQFWNLVYPSPSSEERYVRGFELRPGNPQVVHHATLRIDRTPSARQLDAEQPGPGFGGMEALGAQNPDGHFLGWVPGRMPHLNPKSTAWTLTPTTDLVLELHLFPSGRIEHVRPTIGLFFSDRPPTRAPFMIRLGSRTMDIPAGERAYRVRDEYRLPVDVRVLAVVPHAHYLGHDMKGWAVLPDGRKQWLLRIKEWDFNWQDEFRFRDPVSLPAGTTLVMEFTFDNSAQNVRNPNYPPQRVSYGGRTTDEMGDLWIQVQSAPEQYGALLEDYRRFERKRQVVEHEWLVSREPDDPRLRNDLGHRYASVGRLDEAVEQLLEAVRLRPDYALAHQNLGSVYHRRREPDRALEHFARSLELSDDAVTHVKLARLYLDLDREEPAFSEFERATRLSPRDAELHFEFARALERRDRPRRALESYRRAAELQPDSFAPLNSIALLLATHPDDGVRDAARAIEAAQRAVELSDGPHPVLLETLAASLAADGQFDRAIGTAERALASAVGSGAEPLAQRIRRQLEHYRNGLPYLRERPSGPAS